MGKNINQVRQFWESNPLWTGESNYEPGTKEFFEEHRQVYIQDCFAGEVDLRLFPNGTKSPAVLDLGCGPGFWTVEFGLRGYEEITAADLTHNALDLARMRCDLYDVKARFSQQNAEQLAFDDESFSHVNCLGVIHHTPDTEAAVKEIARVLASEGTASISVYYRNVLLSAWPFLRWGGRLLSKFGAGMPGRGREGIYSVYDVDEIVRIYDGLDNPIGKSYTRQQFTHLLEPYFIIEEMWTFFFPARSLPMPLPRGLHKLLDRTCGFMICAVVRKR